MSVQQKVNSILISGDDLIISVNDSPIGWVLNYKSNPLWKDYEPESKQEQLFDKVLNETPQSVK